MNASYISLHLYKKQNKRLWSDRKQGTLFGGVWMPTNAEVIENLARKLERFRILNDLKECKTLEEFQELVKKYEALCNDDKN